MLTKEEIDSIKVGDIIHHFLKVEAYSYWDTSWGEMMVYKVTDHEVFCKRHKRSHYNKVELDKKVLLGSAVDSFSIYRTYTKK